MRLKTQSNKKTDSKRSSTVIKTFSYALIAVLAINLAICTSVLAGRDGLALAKSAKIASMLSSGDDLLPPTPTPTSDLTDQTGSDDTDKTDDNNTDNDDIDDDDKSVDNDDIDDDDKTVDNDDIDDDNKTGDNDDKTNDTGNKTGGEQTNDTGEPAEITLFTAESYKLHLAAELLSGDKQYKINHNGFVVKSGDFLTAATSFTEVTDTNAAVLTYSFDPDVFTFAGFVPAPGVSVLATVTDASGKAAITVMIPGYNAKDLGSITLETKNTGGLHGAEQTVQLSVAYVLRDASGSKTNVTAESDMLKFFISEWATGDTNGDGIVNLIDLSNVIDCFGRDTESEGWLTDCVYIDFNHDGKIDIQDIVIVTSLLTFEFSVRPANVKLN